MSQKILLFFFLVFTVTNQFQIELKDLFNPSNMSPDMNYKEYDLTFDSDDFAEILGMGYCLSNTLESFYERELTNQGTSSEILWGNPYTNEEIINSYVERGFKSLRIPITFHNHLVDFNYSIDKKWLKRIKDIVDMAINKNLYVIINMHHDVANYTENSIKYGSGFYPMKKDMIESEKFIYNIWRQIAITFNSGYDHHLIFESFNEPRLKNTENENSCSIENEICKEAIEIINEYNDLVLQAIRSTGVNNKYRFIIFHPLNNLVDNLILNSFILPDDSKYNKNNRILIGVKIYNNFANGNKKILEENEKNELLLHFSYLYQNYILKGYNVIITEMGSKDNNNNLEERINYAKYFVENARYYHLASFLWEIKYDRNNLSWESDELVNAYIKAAETPFQEEQKHEKEEKEEEEEREEENNEKEEEKNKDREEEKNDEEENKEKEENKENKENKEKEENKENKEEEKNKEEEEHSEDITFVDLFNQTDLVIDSGYSIFAESLSSDQLTEKLGMAFDLSDSLDAYDKSNQNLKLTNEGLNSEKSFGNPFITTEQITAYKDIGFKAIRIPVSWHNHIIDSNYTIDPRWMRRVKTVVDYCIKQNLYVILSMQNDYNYGYFFLEREYRNSLKFIYNVWRQITFAFNRGYDEHLIFESFDQVNFDNCLEYNNYCEQEYLMLNQYNSLVLRVVRLSANNNQFRFILFPPLNSDKDLLKKFKMPSDYNNTIARTLLIINFNIPYDFTLNEGNNYKRFEEKYKLEIIDNLDYLEENFYHYGYNVILNKIGSVNKHNLRERIKYAEFLVGRARKKHMGFVLGLIEEERNPVEFKNRELVKTYIRTAEKYFI